MTFLLFPDGLFIGVQAFLRTKDFDPKIRETFCGWQ